MKRFKDVVNENRHFLMAYTTIGDPYSELNLEVANAMIKGGADILELGIPSKDPKYDGPIIRASYKRASKSGLDVRNALNLARNIRGAAKIVLSYYDSINPLNLEEMAELSADSGAEAVLIPDLLIDHTEKIDAYVKAVKLSGLEPVFFMPATLPYRWIERIIELKPTMIYLGLMPATGIELPLDPVSAISRIKEQIGRIPLAVGFAIYEPDQVVAYLKAGANGVVVGSAFAKIIETRKTEIHLMLDEIRELAEGFKKNL